MIKERCELAKQVDIFNLCTQVYVLIYKKTTIVYSGDEKVVL